MPAKSFLGETREAAHRFYAMSVRGEVSDENIQAYMRAASQIQEIWQQIDERIAALQMQGTLIWDAYAQFGYPLAFIRSARAYQVFVQELLSADTAFDPQTVGYLPRITYDQTNALCYQMQGALHDAVASLHDPAYTLKGHSLRGEASEKQASRAYLKESGDGQWFQTNR